jgi:hypothetical protein
MRTFRTSYLILIIANVVLVSGLSLAAQDAAVIMASPHWEVDGKELHPGSALSPSEHVNHTTADFGHLVLDCGKLGWIHYAHEGFYNLTPCDPREVGQRVDKGRETGQTAQNASSFLDYLSRSQGHFIFFGSRGSGGDPNDGVVLLKNGELHLGPVLLRVLEGEYCLGLKSLNALDLPERDLHLKWDRSDEPEGLVKALEVTTGVYRLEKKILDEGVCSSDPTSSPAWVLITSESDFNSLRSRWNDNRSWFQDLSDRDPAVLLTIKHAAIAQLSEPKKH